MPLTISIPPALVSASIKCQPWLVLGLLLTSIALQLVSVVPNEALRRGVAIVGFKIGQAELSILTTGGASIFSDAGDGGGGDQLYINMWGWCVTETCSEAKLPPSFKLLEAVS
jgi:hypothetical protein